jgi:histidine triad (HIT) family protein
MTCNKCEQIKDSGRILYEDENAVAVLVSKATTKGHILVMPKKHVATIEELDENMVQHLFYIANYSASALFEVIGAQGTNIISEEGEHFSLNVIARKQEDGLNFTWEPKQLPQPEMDSIISAIKSKITVQETKKEKAAPVETNKEPEQIEAPKEGERNYQMDVFNRIP